MARWYIYRVAGNVHIDVQVHTRAKADDVYALLRDGASWPVWAPIGSFQLDGPGTQTESARYGFSARAR